MKVYDYRPIIFCILVLVVLFNYGWWDWDGPGHTPKESGEGQTTVINDNYMIDIISMPSLSIDNVTYALPSTPGSRRPFNISGEVSNITVLPYRSDPSQYHSKKDPMNYTDINSSRYYLAFIDRDENEMVDPGDAFLLKGTGNGGKAGEDQTFMIINKKNDRVIWEVLLPAT